MLKRIKHGIKTMRDHVASRLSMSSDSFTYVLICILVILGPLFFIPVKGFSIGESKGFLIFFVGVLGLLSCVAQRRDQSASA